MILELPFPPSMNRYWRRAGNHIHISNEGKAFRADVAAIAFGSGSLGTDQLSMTIEAFPPDRRRRDLDNLLKATLDALEHAGVYENDNQIADLRIVREEVVKGGKIRVVVRKFGETA